MRNNDKTLVIDCRGYISAFNLILGFWLLTTRMGFNLVGEVWNNGCSAERAAATMRKLMLRLGFMFGVKLAWGGDEEVHPNLYRGVGGVWKGYDSN
jgi:hypothetical protein